MYQAEIAIAAVIPKDRFRVDFGNLEELKLSIRERGLITPIAAQTNKDGTFRLLAGERRLKACAELGHEMIAAKIWTEELTELDIRCIELAENIHRKEFSWQEKMRLEAAIHALQVGEHGEKVGPTGTGHSQADTARFLGVSVGGLSENLKLAKAIDNVPELAESKTREEALKKLRMLQESVIHEELLRRANADVSPNTSVSDLKIEMCNSYIVADALEALPLIADESMDFIELDPPYGVDLNKTKRSVEEGLADYEEVEDPAYYEFMGKVLNEAVRILKPQRWLILWHGSNHAGVLHSMLEARGLHVATVPAIWVKPTGQVNHPEYAMANCYEPFLYASKGNAILIKQGRPNIFHFSPVPPTRKIHPTEKPIELLEAVLQTFTMKGQKVLSPFLGSGAALMAAANLGLEATGFDLSTRYKKSYEVRILSQPHGRYFNSTEVGK